MTVQDLKFLGFVGWVDLAKYVKRNELEKFEAIRLPKHALAVDPAALPKFTLTPTDEDCWILSIEEIKANAFDELFAALPMGVSIRVVIESILERETKNDGHVISFIKKIPTRDL